MAAAMIDELHSLQFSFGGVKAREAPLPKNIKWENLESNRRKNAIKGWALTVAFFYLMLVLSIGAVMIS
jgi:hypothetical protein